MEDRPSMRNLDLGFCAEAVLAGKGVEGSETNDFCATIGDGFP